MVVEKSIVGIHQSHAMNGGEGPYSYAQNSSYQRGVVEATKELVREAIATSVDVKTLLSASLSSFIRLADLGCSTGPNTFQAVQNIMEAIELKYQSSQELTTLEIPEFQVFFNDTDSNDFNTLFGSLPPNRKYLVAGVPGSFHGILFPKNSLHFINSSYALHWLSEVPKEVTDRNSPTWNKGRIHYSNSSKEVVQAYSAQFARGVNTFLSARSQELVTGGLMTLSLPAVPDVILDFHTTSCTELDLMGSCLMDMVKMGLVGEDEVDSFNLPVYYTCPTEFKALIERHGQFSIEKMDLMYQKKHALLPDLNKRILYKRAAYERLFEKHFGSAVTDKLFNCYSKELAKSSIYLNPEKHQTTVLFVSLKKKCCT